MSSFPAALPLSPGAATALLRAALHDRVVGVLVGSALGDAIGLYTEFLSAAAAAEAYPSRSFTLAPSPAGLPTPFKVDLHRAPKEPGHWTDDTDHALLLLLAFLHTARRTESTAAQGDGGDPAASGATSPLPTQQDLAARLRVWVTQGFRPLDTLPLGLGRLVGGVVATAGFERDPETVAREYWERTGRRVAPNGSLMRTHPLGVVCLFRGEEEAFRVAAEMSRVTHYDPRCVLACVVGTGLVRVVARGEVACEGDVDACIERAVEWCRSEFEQKGGGGLGVDAEELWRHVRPEQGLDGLRLDEQAAIGYVYKTLGSGVVLLRMVLQKTAETRGGLLERTQVFEDLVTDLIMRGGDADTNACFAGALLGGYLGYAALPDHWKHGLRHGEWLLGKAEALCQVLGLMDGNYDGRRDKDTEPNGGQPVLTQDDMEPRWMALQHAAMKKMEEAAKDTSPPASSSRWSLPWYLKGKARG